MVNGHVGQGQPKAHDIGRWAHINVKLHFSHFSGLLSTTKQDDNVIGSVQEDTVMQLVVSVRQSPKGND